MTAARLGGAGRTSRRFVQDVQELCDMRNEMFYALV